MTMTGFRLSQQKDVRPTRVDSCRRSMGVKTERF